MAHVTVRLGSTPDDPRGAKLTVDGVDITKAVLADGFGVDFYTEGGGVKAIVTMRLRADQLDMDLPKSVLNMLDDTQEV